MLQPFDRDIDDVAIIYAHSGLKTDGENSIYSISAIVYSRGGKKREYSSHINYPHFSVRDRFYSNLSKEILASAPSYQEVSRELKEFLNNQKFIVFFDTYNNTDALFDICGINRFIDLSFVSEFFYPHIGACTPKIVWEFLYGKERTKVSFGADEIVALIVRTGQADM